ncbi:MAG: DEAD/DEAH box helicase, partial [Pirellula sp.]
MSTTLAPAPIPPRFLKMLQEVWGFSQLRDAQEKAIAAALGQRDALVVMPTGGGKSLCYQAPALYLGGCTIVISPLIALMKDQVDG